MSRLILIEERRKRLMQLLKQYHRGAKQAARNLKKSSFELFGSSRWKLGGLLTRPFSKKGKEPHTGLVNASKALEKTIRRLNEIDLSTLSGDSNSNGGVIIPCSSNLPDTKPD